MGTVVLVRHGRSTANTSGVLAGRTPGVHLDDHGREQATALAARLAGVRLSAAFTSPQERCRETADLALAQVKPLPALEVVPDLAECDYGEWQGRTIKELAELELWSVVQRQPSAAAFPGGESLREMQQRAVRAIRGADERLEAQHGPDSVWLVVSHGDVIKSVLADALGMHLDLFQRIHVDPASVSVIRYTGQRPYVLASNTHAGDLAWLNPAAAGDTDAAVGGGAGPAPTSA